MFMKENNLNIEMNIADAIIEKPIGFKVGNRHLCLYPPTLGKTYLLSRLFKALGVNTEIIKVNPYLESLRLCKEKKGIVCRILSYHTLCRKEEILNDVIVSKRSDFLMKRLNDEELSQLFILSTSWDDAEIYIKYLEGIINCDVNLKGYSKTFMQVLKSLGNMIYPLVSGQGTYRPPTVNENNGGMGTFSQSMNDTLNQMKRNF